MTGYRKAISTQDLIEVLDHIPAGDRKFAQSLIDSEKTYGNLSEKQLWYVEAFYLTATGQPVAPHPTFRFRGFTPIGVKVAEAQAPKAREETLILMKLFAKTGMKMPKVFVRVGEERWKFSVLGPTSKTPGDIAITAGPEYRGRFNKEGAFIPYQGRTLDPDMWEALSEFLEDPQTGAKSYAKAEAHCCFCGDDLTDERSIAVGYGPICAGHYGLPWGEPKRAIEPTEVVA